MLFIYQYGPISRQATVWILSKERLSLETLMTDITAERSESWQREANRDLRDQIGN